MEHRPDRDNAGNQFPPRYHRKPPRRGACIQVRGEEMVFWHTTRVLPLLRPCFLRQGVLALLYPLCHSQVLRYPGYARRHDAHSPFLTTKAEGRRVRPFFYPHERGDAHRCFSSRLYRGHFWSLLYILDNHGNILHWFRHLPIRSPDSRLVFDWYSFTSSFWTYSTKMCVSYTFAIFKASLSSSG